jgi:hypothetical protein
MSTITLRQSCNRSSAILASVPYSVQSKVSIDSFSTFVAALNCEPVCVTIDNVSDLSLLCEEFGYCGLRGELSAVRASADYKLLQHEARLAASELRLDMLSQEISKLRNALDQNEHAVCGVGGVREGLEKVESDLNGLTLRVGASEATIEQLRDTVLRQQEMKADICLLERWTSAMDSRIISDFPAIFDEFRGKWFSLLWRGSRDGFKPNVLHNRCDGHSHTLTMIHDTDGNIFGGYTPLEWESREWNGNRDETNSCLKCDNRLKSFIFTLKNPHNIPAKRFALKEDRKQWAIFCEPTYVPIFGCYPADIDIRGNCHIKGGLSSTDGFGTTYTNDTGLAGGTVLTSSPKFTVKDIEVFEIMI